MPASTRSRVSTSIGATALSVLLLALVACSGDNSGFHTSLDPTSGLVTVVNSGRPVWEPGEEWRIEEVFRIGGESGPRRGLFRGPLTSVRRRADGDIFVLEATAAMLWQYAPDGTFIRTIGRPGPGPGELRAPASMAWDASGRLWVPALFNRRYTLFDAAGEFIRTVPRPVHGGYRLQHAMRFEGAGTLIDEAWDATAIVFLRLDTTGAVLDSFPPLEYPKRPHAMIPRGFDDRVLDYLPSFVWTLAPDGTVWFANSGELRLIQRTLEGDTLRVIETVHRDPTLDAETRRFVERGMSRLGVPESSYTVVRPTVQAIHALPDGHLLVRVVEHVGEPSALFDVFDPDGRYLGAMRTDLPWTTRGLPDFVGDTVFAVVIGDLDVPFVSRGILRRP